MSKESVTLRCKVTSIGEIFDDEDDGTCDERKGIELMFLDEQAYEEACDAGFLWGGASVIRGIDVTFTKE